jgi:hypothetical protein
MSSTLRSVNCKICKRQAPCRFGSGNVIMLPAGWERFEDQTPDNKGPLTEICSERCKASLREKNRISRMKRSGY